MNGVQGDRFFDNKCTRDSTRSIDGGGSAIDFFACSIEIFESLQSLHIDEKSHFSDHQKLMLSWSGLTNWPDTVGGAQVAGAQDNSRYKCVANGPKGWCFLGSLSEAAKHNFCRGVALDSRLQEVEDVCCTGRFLQEGADSALRLLHTITREAWEREGL